ncbi:MAG: helix-turn-helix domain-containing protein [Methyloceanibacter sp.]|nr:helix-turn-helix domain-containing protein [Methyloceanibacter sp.]
MQRIFSTDNIAPRERFDFFVDELCKQARLSARRVETDHAFGATLQMAQLAGSTLMVSEVTSCETMRSKTQIAQCDSEELFVCLQLQGSVPNVTDGQEVVLRPGDVWINDLRRPFHEGVYSTRSLTWGIPRALLEARIGSTERLSMQKLHPGAPAARLATTMLRALSKHCTALDKIAASKVQDSLLNLLTVAYLGDDSPFAATQSYARIASRFRLKSTVEMHLFDSRLNASDFAKKSGITLRHANHLLASDGTTLERYIFERRLERCRAVLDNPTFDFRQVSEIAYSHGFASLAHFSRKFKEAFGMTPAEYRVRRTQSHRAA